MADILLYGSPLSPFFRKAEFLLRSKGVAFDTENVPVLGMPDWYVALNPGRRIPTLRDRTLGGEGPAGTIPDSSAMCAFIDKKYPEPSFYPEDPFTLGRALWFEEFADTDLAGIVGSGIFRPIMFPRFQGQESDLATAKASAVEKLPEKLAYLDSVLAAGPYLGGETLTIGDVAVASVFAQYALVAQLPKGFPHFRAFYERMTALPALAENLALCRKMLSKALPEPLDLSA